MDLVDMLVADDYPEECIFEHDEALTLNEALALWLWMVQHEPEAVEHALVQGTGSLVSGVRESTFGHCPLAPMGSSPCSNTAATVAALADEAAAAVLI